MSDATSKSEERLLRFFRYLNRFMVALWRLGLGGGVNGWPSVGGRIMVLTHLGRRTGIRRRTPLNYAIVDGDVYCTAGFGGGSDWYRNILADPQVEIWLPDGWWAGSASDLSGSDARIDLLRKVLIASGFAAWLAGIRRSSPPSRRSTGCSGSGGATRLPAGGGRAIWPGSGRWRR
jgi:deazaflavin-dependent oxidoreductase (nitroreductase family)